MSKSFLLTVAVTNYYEIEVNAPDSDVIEKFKDPDFARHIEGDGLEKIMHPEWHRSSDKREVAIVDIIEGIDV